MLLGSNLQEHCLLWGATEVPDPLLEASVLPASLPKDRLWAQKPAKCRNRVENAAECYVRVETSQGKHRSLIMPISWTGGHQKVCLFNKKYKERLKENLKKKNQESASLSCHPVAGPRVFCAGEPNLSRVQVLPGAQQEQDPPPAPLGQLLSLTEPWFLATGKCPARLLGGELVKRGVGTWQLLIGFASPTAGPPRAVPWAPSSPSCLPCPCTGLPILSFFPAYMCLPTHISYQGLFVPSGTSPASFCLFQTQI